MQFFNYSVGVFKNGRVEIIANDQGNRITPSYVAFTGEGERLIGDAAKNQLTTNPENTIFDAKRLIGREWSDSAVQHDLKYFPFKVLEKQSKPHVEVETSQGNKVFSAEEISSMVLIKMKEVAEAYLGKKVTHAVVTVPAVSLHHHYIYINLYYRYSACIVFITHMSSFTLNSISMMLNVKLPKMLEPLPV